MQIFYQRQSVSYFCFFNISLLLCLCFWVLATNLANSAEYEGMNESNALNTSMQQQNMDDQIISIQKQMMMNNLMLTNHLKAMNNSMQSHAFGQNMNNMLGMHAHVHSMNHFDELDDIDNMTDVSAQSVPKLNIGQNVSDGNDASSYKDEDEKVNEQNANNLMMQQASDCFDALLVGQTECVLMEANNTRARCAESNERRWYNVFGSMITENQIQYHWKIKLIDVEADCLIIIGILDACCIDKYVQHNQKQKNADGYFAKSQYGYGINADGNLQNGGRDGGKYCNEFKSGDVVDVYFDMKQFVLWYGVNGEEYGVACKVNGAFYKLCIAMFGSNHCVQIESCDTYSYS